MHHKTWKRLAVIWGSYMTDPFPLTAKRNCPMRRFLRKKTSFGYFCWEKPRMKMGVSQERKCLLSIVSQKLISYDFLYFLCIAQSEEDLWRFQVEACRAYTCKQIIGLCQSGVAWRQRKSSWQVKCVLDWRRPWGSRPPMETNWPSSLVLWQSARWKWAWLIFFCTLC